jgi:hypothetical protein
LARELRTVRLTLFDTSNADKFKETRMIPVWAVEVIAVTASAYVALKKWNSVANRLAQELRKFGELVVQCRQIWTDFKGSWKDAAIPSAEKTASVDRRHFKDVHHIVKPRSKNVLPGPTPIANIVTVTAETPSAGLPTMPPLASAN